MTPATTEASCTAPCLRGRLPFVSPDQADLSRCLADKRLVDWIKNSWPWPLALAPSVCVDAVLGLVFDTAAGGAELGVPLGDLPPAWQAAAAMAPQALRHEVLAHLLEPHLDHWARLVPGLRLAGGSILPAASRDGWQVCAGVRRLYVLRADDSLLRNLLANNGAGACPASHLRRIQVPGTLRLLTRYWPAVFIGSLEMGDIVLAGGRPLKGKLLMGSGNIIEADVAVDIEQSTVSVQALRNAAPDAVPQAGASLEDVELPVSFEIDTARIALSELASIEPGYVVRLDAPIEQARIHIVCHGQVIGEGTLVAVGEQLGVRIQRIGAP